ncbi:MAG: DMT family transporter [Burkholderiaceae bacterium]|nr:DMT family transporter [Burkholderiaceae bacterium]
MKSGDLTELFLLAAIWGGSFLFLRVGVGEFGAVSLAGMRVIGAALLLLLVLALRGHIGELRRHWRPVLLLGLTNTALPFLCFSYAALSITAGLASIFNATTPLFGALVAWAWLKHRLTRLQVLGLVVGFAGVLWLATSNVNNDASFKPGGSGWAVVACLGATAMYGASASYTTRWLAGVSSLTVSAGILVSAAALLLIPTLLWWPVHAPSLSAWLAVAMLAFVCTGVAYLMYFRLLARVGPANAMAVTFLIPMFAMLWGSVFLDEVVTVPMLLGGAIILSGTGLTMGLLKLPVRG